MLKSILPPYAAKSSGKIVSGAGLDVGVRCLLRKLKLKRCTLGTVDRAKGDLTVKGNDRITRRHKERTNSMTEGGKPLLFDMAGKRIYVGGHTGMVGAAIVRRIKSKSARS